MLLHPAWTHLGVLLALFPHDQPAAGSSAPSGQFGSGWLRRDPGTQPPCNWHGTHTRSCGVRQERRLDVPHSSCAQVRGRWTFSLSRSRPGLAMEALSWTLCYQLGSTCPCCSPAGQETMCSHQQGWWSHYVWDILPAAVSRVAVLVKAHFLPHVSMH